MLMPFPLYPFPNNQYPPKNTSSAVDESCGSAKSKFSALQSEISGKKATN